MYYHTPDTSRYIKFIRRFRMLIIMVFIAISAFAFNFLKPELITSDTVFWLSESKQLEKNQEQSYAASYIGHLSIDISSFNDSSKNSLQTLQTELEHINGVVQVESLFSAYMIFNDRTSDESALVKALPIAEMPVEKIVSFVQSFPDPYRPFVNNNFHRFHFIIHSKTPIQLDHLKIPFDYTYSEPQVEAKLSHYLWYIGIIILVVMGMSHIVFKNFIAGFAAISVTVITLIWTFTLIYLLTGTKQIHIAMSLMVVSIAIGHYLYFYYRWHVSQFKSDPNQSSPRKKYQSKSPSRFLDITRTSDQFRIPSVCRFADCHHDEPQLNAFIHRGLCGQYCIFTCIAQLLFGCISQNFSCTDMLLVRQSRSSL